MKRIRFGMLLLVVALAIQITWYVVLMVSYVRTPGKLEGADFLTYYSVGRVAREYGLIRVYNLDLEAAAQAQTAGVSLGFQQILPPNHPPFLYPLLGVLAGLDYRAAYFGYAVLLVVIIVAGLPALYRVLLQNGWSQTQAWLELIGVLLFEPLFMSVLKGQDSALLLLGGLLWFSGLTRNNDRLAGLGLSLALIRPQIALVLAVPFLFRRRKVFGWFCAGAAALGFYCFLQVGWTGALDYLHILTVSAGGEGYGMAEMAMFN
ncbi:MAG: glycosyltransferase 87 family protein [Chloroflexi bacterium]|nr:glycosyltransferase 87 family protein [Chloroflexota bacterium]